VKQLSILITLWVLISSVQVMAQTQLTYGDTITSRLTDNSPTDVYSFTGSTDDRISVQVMSLSDTFVPVIELRRGITTVFLDGITNDGLTTRFDFTLPDSGTYLLLVSSDDSQTGEFVLHLSAELSDDATRFTGVPGQIVLSDGATAYYIVNNDASSPQILTLRGQSSEAVFYASIYDTDYDLIQLSVGATAFVFVEANRTVLLDLRGASNVVTATWLESTMTSLPQATEVVEVSTATVVPQISVTPSPEEEETEEPIYISPTFAADAECAIFSGGFPNIRTGPGVTFGVITQVRPDQVYPVVGVYTNWYQIFVPIFGSGWVRNDVVGLGGNCAGIPALPPDNTPILPTTTPTTTNTPTATFTFTPTPTPTLTSTPTITPSPTASDTPRPTSTEVIQLAPEDAEFNSPLTIVLGGTTSVSEFISFPDGDSEDMILWDITGMSEIPSEADGRAQLVINATCFGDATDTVEFVIDDDVFACGETLVDREVRFEDKTGEVTIRLTGGDNVYVQWVLQASATRINN